MCVLHHRTPACKHEALSSNPIPTKKLPQIRKPQTEMPPGVAQVKESVYFASSGH
jgi:hypothetical protein